MHDLGVADELQCHEPRRAREVVLAHGVVVALDRSEHEVADVADVLEGGGDLLGLGQIERERQHARVAVQAPGDLRAPAEVPAGDDDVPALCRERLGQSQPDAGGATDDDDGSVCHGRQR